MTKPRGYSKHILALDVETSGLHFSSDNPCVNSSGYYQVVSGGFIVVDSDTLKPVDELYVEIKWDGESLWSSAAENVHGLSKKHLDQHGMSREAAVVSIAELILRYWKPSDTIHLMGHNVHRFDLCFLQQLMRSEGIELKFGNKNNDSHSVGFAVFGTHNSDDLFEMLGFGTRQSHNSLDDAKMSLAVFQTVRALANKCFE